MLLIELPGFTLDIVRRIVIYMTVSVFFYV